MNDEREEESTALVHMSGEVLRPPELVLQEAQRAAKALQDVYSQKRKKVMMNGEQYLEFEDWQLVARFYGCVVMCDDEDVEYLEMGGFHGFRARARVINARGQVIGKATAFCLTDEEKWRERPLYEYFIVRQDGRVVPEAEAGPKSEWVWEPRTDGKNVPKKQRVQVGTEPVPLFQLSSMAQTRACAKACRQLFSWVVLLAGYATTPAEEIQDMPAAEIKQAGSTSTPVANGGGAKAKDERPITEPQLKRLFAIGKGLTQVQIEEAAARHGFDALKSITRAGYDDVVADVQALAEVAQKNPAALAVLSGAIVGKIVDSFQDLAVSLRQLEARFGPCNKWTETTAGALRKVREQIIAGAAAEDVLAPPSATVLPFANGTTGGQVENGFPLADD